MRYSRRTVAAARRTARTAVIPAPTLGWNTTDPLSAMKPGYAIILDNFFPSEGRCDLRQGCDDHATGMTGVVDTLMVWEGPSGSNLFAAANNNIYDVTSTGAVGAAEATGAAITSNRWQWENFGAGGGNHLFLVNGTDDPRYYNGSAWTVPSITGVTASTLITVTAHQSRLWLIQKDTSKIWYLGTSAVAGAATSIDFSSLFPLGGYLMAMGSWSRDGGSGISDLAVFVSSEGDLLIYEGSDPSSPTTWAKIGSFRVAPPIGRRCLLKAGADLMLLTIEGVIPLSQFLGVDRAAEKRVALTAKIAPSWVAAAKAYGSLFGWQGISYPRGGYALFNVPIDEGEEQHQYILNVLTGAWCRFKGQDANCWAMFNDDLYFGGNDGIVYKADTGVSDNDNAIVGDMKPAFDYFGSVGMKKAFTAIQPILNSNGTPLPALEVLVDYQDRVPTAVATSSSGTGSAWDVAEWDVAEWGGDSEWIANWTGVFGIGYCGTVRMRFSSTAVTLGVTAFNLLYQPAGVH